MNRKEAESACICDACPTYVDCGERLAFCMWETGKSKCIRDENGCICPDCVVQVEMRYEHEYYCTHGSEKVLTQKKTGGEN
jgi:hypothetical protein